MSSDTPGDNYPTKTDRRDIVKAVAKADRVFFHKDVYEDLKNE